MDNTDQLPEEMKIAIKYTIALIACGFTVTKIIDFETLVHHHFPSPRLITRAMNILRPLLRNFANESCSNWTRQIPDHSIISIDGSWNHRRHGSFEIFDVICVQSKKNYCI